MKNSRPPLPLTALYDRGLQPVTLGPALASGSEGAIHPSTSHPGLVAKILHRQPLPSHVADKLTYMVQNPPPVIACSAYRVAWPASIITRPKRDGRPVGYLMSHIDQDRYREIGAYFNPARRRRRARLRGRPYTFLHLLAMAQNVAHAIAHVHAQGHLVADLNSRNVLANDRAQIALVDTDSFQIVEADTQRVHVSAVGTPEYTTPRMQGRILASKSRTQDDDLFALAVLVYQLLFQGHHPFAGNYTREHTDINTLADRIRLGTFAHGPQTKVTHRPVAATALIWSDTPLKKQFQAAFRRRGSRTSAQEWADAIQEASATLTTCSASPLHIYFASPTCTWCKYRHITGVEPFGSVETTTHSIGTERSRA